jgi:hypothetical protein
MKKFICWLVGHKRADINRGFSYRMGICVRCGKLKAFEPIGVEWFEAQIQLGGKND